VRSLKATSPATPTPLVCWVYQDWEGDFAMSFADYKVAYITVRCDPVWCVALCSRAPEC
jgi:hypothetical protein